jgi:hypothetical protein
MPTRTVSTADLVFNPLTPITFSDYVDGIRIAAPYMKSLALTLANSQPDDLDEAARKQLSLLADIAKHGDDVLDERQGVLGVRPTLDDFTSVWGGLYEGLVAKSRMPASFSDRGERAATLVTRIFPDGVSFVRRDAHAAWSDGDRRLALIAELGLEGELDQIAGADHLEAAKKATAALGEALGVGHTRRESLRGADLQATVARFSREVARYARMIAASVNVADPITVARFRSAVAEPIDGLRSRRGGSDEGPLADPSVEPATPVVALPSAPVIASPSTPGGAPLSPFVAE